MKKNVLFFGDSMLSGVAEFFSNDDLRIHVESFPGATAKSCVEAVQTNNVVMNLVDLFAEDNYDAVVICFGTNDLGNDEFIGTVVDCLLFLQNICQQQRVETIVQMLLHGGGRKNIQFNEVLLENTDDSVKICEFLMFADDTLFDGVHLNKQGKQQLADDLEQQLLQRN